MKTYVGNPRDRDWLVYVHKDGNKVVTRLNPRNDVINHSPDGFAWGFGGSGPAQLSLALLIDAWEGHCADYVPKAKSLYQHFKRRIIARIGQEEHWSMSDTMVRALSGLVEADIVKTRAYPEMPPPSDVEITFAKQAGIIKE